MHRENDYTYKRTELQNSQRALRPSRNCLNEKTNQQKLDREEERKNKAILVQFICCYCIDNSSTSSSRNRSRGSCSSSSSSSSSSNSSNSRSGSGSF